VRRRERSHHSLLGIHGELSILHKTPRQSLLNESRDICAIGTVPIEYTDDSHTICPEDAEIVLVGALRLKALFAGEANLEDG